MRIKIFLFFALILLSSCTKVFKDRTDHNSEPDINKQYLVGNDKDSNGCIGSAGYTWSVLKNDCVRLFEIGYRLNPVQLNSNEAIISAFIVFDKEKNKVELFLPNKENSLILEKKDDMIYVKDKYKFNSRDFLLEYNGDLIFEAAKENLINIDDSIIDENEE